MKKVPWGEIVLGAVVGFWVTIIIVKLLGLFGGLLGKLTADNIINLIGVVASLGAIYAVFKSTEKQIKNQNKENHRPYIVVYYDEAFYGVDELETILNIENMGYGIATNVKIWSNDKLISIYDIGIGSVAKHGLKCKNEEEGEALILYSDLYNNIYSCLVKYNSKPTRAYQDNTKEYTKYIKTIDYQEVLKMYKKETGL